MKEDITSKIVGPFRRVTTAIVAIGIVAAPAVHAKPKSEAMTDKRAEVFRPHGTFRGEI
jgi:hypothetical protein